MNESVQKKIEQAVNALQTISIEARFSVTMASVLQTLVQAHKDLNPPDPVEVKAE